MNIRQKNKEYLILLISIKKLKSKIRIRKIHDGTRTNGHDARGISQAVLPVVTNKKYFKSEH